MNKQKLQLMGSESRDRFKHIHKNRLHDQFYALDIDFALIERNKWAAEDGSHLPLIVAILDFKMPDDRPTFSEVLAYNQFIKQNIPVYIVEANSDDFVDKDPSKHRLTVYEYQGGDWEPEIPDWDGDLVLEDATWRDFEKWQDELRIKRRNIEKARHKVRNMIQETKDDVDELDMYKAADVMEEVLLNEQELIEKLMEDMDDIG